MANLGQMVVKIVGDVTDLNKSIDVAQNKFNAATSNFQKLGANLTKFVTLPILGIGAAAVKSAADMEMQQAAFETMLGSAEKAKKLLKDLTDLAAKTPFQLTDLANASKTMLAFGIANEKVLPNLRMLGDVAGGDSEKLRTLTLAFSQIQSTGRLMGQDLLQLVNAGFNPLQIISEKTGKTMAELKKEMEKGAISADMVSDAFKTATSEGGRFFGGMERASLTLKGLISTLLDNLVALGRSLGDILLPSLKKLVVDITTMVQKFTSLDEQTRKNIISWGLFAAALGPTILGVLKLAEAYNKLSVLLNAGGVAAGGPVAIAIAGFVAISAAVLAFSNNLKTAQTQFKNLKLILEGGTTGSAADDLKTVTTEIERVKALIGSSEGLIPGETDGLDAQLERLKKIRAELAEKARWQGLNEKGANAIAEAAKKQAEQEAALEESERKRLEIYAEAAKKQAEQEAALEESERKRLEISAKLEEDRETAHQAELNRIEDEKKQRRDAYEYIYGQFDSIMDGIYSNEIARIEQSELSEEEKARKIAQIKRKQAVWDKAQAIADIAINTAVAVTKILYRPVLAAVVAALGLAQAAVVASTPLPEIPSFANGGIVQPQPGGVQATVAEAGVAEAIIPLDRLDNMLSQGGGTTHLVVNLDSRPLLEKIFDATRNGTVLISSGAVV